jgi:hypothetical protein
MNRITQYLPELFAFDGRRGGTGRDADVCRLPVRNREFTGLPI